MLQRLKVAMCLWTFLAALLSVVPVARAGKQPLTPELVTHGYQVVAPSISRIMWRPGHEQVSYVKDDDMGDGVWLYDVASGKARRLDVAGSAEEISRCMQSVTVDSVRVLSPSSSCAMAAGANRLIASTDAPASQMHFESLF